MDFFDIRDLDGNKTNKGSLSYKRIRLIKHNHSWLINQKEVAEASLMNKVTNLCFGV